MKDAEQALSRVKPEAKVKVSEQGGVTYAPMMYYSRSCTPPSFFLSLLQENCCWDRDEQQQFLRLVIYIAELRNGSFLHLCLPARQCFYHNSDNTEAD